MAFFSLKNISERQIMHILFFEKVLVILKKNTKCANFGGQFPLNQ